MAPIGTIHGTTAATRFSVVFILCERCLGHIGTDATGPNREIQRQMLLYVLGIAVYGFASILNSFLIG